MSRFFRKTFGDSSILMTIEYDGWFRLLIEFSILTPKIPMSGPKF
ncbi:hypothetical protein [Leptospira ainlahdjerensis]|nr:hypothetical protein [Leptospira ainlahdjerensis]